MKNNNFYTLFLGDEWLSSASLSLVGVFSNKEEMIKVMKRFYIAEFGKNLLTETDVEYFLNNLQTQGKEDCNFIAYEVELDKPVAF